MHTVLGRASLWLGICWCYPYPSGLLHWHWGNLMIAPVPVKLPWGIWVDRPRESMGTSQWIHVIYYPDCFTIPPWPQHSKINPCAYFMADWVTGFNVLFDSEMPYTTAPKPYWYHILGILYTMGACEDSGHIPGFSNIDWPFTFSTGSIS